ncbi:FecR domain-containing protein [Reichenbachiella sp. MALMAid0571]|uniref:FecR family protein n=1 Tax=Reichenbachiella sp. MALMAid0571 TaxID=3143939 RepID=UPI0032E038FA
MENIDETIARVLTGNPEKNDVQRLEDWASESETNRKTYLILTEKWKKTNTSISHNQSHRIYQKIQQGTGVAKTTERFGWYRSIGRIAAAVALLAGLGLLFYFVQMKYKTPGTELAISQIVKENPSGVKSQVKLPDGTLVWLNAASSISYLPNFTDTNRLVSLKGEAYFEVVKDKDRPFRVTSDQVVTTALGTSFNINAHEKDKIKISLTTGKVDVLNTGNNEQVVLHPGQQATTVRSGFSVSSFDNEKVLAWKDGTIYFDDTGFDEMMTTLGRWYGAEFRVQNLSTERKKSLKITGKYPNMSLENMLDVLSYSQEFEYEINDKTVTIKF